MVTESAKLRAGQAVLTPSINQRRRSAESNLRLISSNEGALPVLAGADVMAARGMAESLETAIATAVRLLRVELDEDLVAIALDLEGMAALRKEAAATVGNPALDANVALAAEVGVRRESAAGGHGGCAHDGEEGGGRELHFLDRGGVEKGDWRCRWMCAEGVMD